MNRWLEVITNPATGRVSVSKLTVATAQLLSAAAFTAWNVALLPHAWQTGQLPGGLVEYTTLYALVAGIQFAASKTIAARRGKAGVDE